MCHLILLLPVFGLPLFWIWPIALALPVYTLISLLSGWVYYYAIVAMRQQATVGPETLIGSYGEVVSTDDWRLSVRVQSILWGASSPDELVPGERIEVVGIDGLTLRVKKRCLDSTGGYETRIET